MIRVYDNFEWMEKVGDPGFHYHALLTEVLSLLILEFSDRYVLPFDMTAYASSLIQWTMDLENWAENKGANVEGNTPWSIEPLKEAVLKLAKDAKRFEQWELEWDTRILASGNMESGNVALRRKAHNNRMANFETHLLDLEEGGGVSSSFLPKLEILLTLRRYQIAPNSNTSSSRPNFGPVTTLPSSPPSAMPLTSGTGISPRRK